MSEVPNEVAEASKRLGGGIQERPVVKTAPMPAIFRAVIENDNARAAIMSESATMTQDDWRRLKALNHDKKTNLRPSAERALAWNTDKGNRG